MEVGEFVTTTTCNERTVRTLPMRDPRPWENQPRLHGAGPMASSCPRAGGTRPRFAPALGQAAMARPRQHTRSDDAPEDRVGGPAGPGWTSGSFDDEMSDIRSRRSARSSIADGASCSATPTCPRNRRRRLLAADSASAAWLGRTRRLSSTSSNVLACTRTSRRSPWSVRHMSTGRDAGRRGGAVDVSAPPTLSDVVVVVDDDDDDDDEWCRTRLARYKKPTQLLVVDSLPRNASGMVPKPTLRPRLGVQQYDDTAPLRRGAASIHRVGEKVRRPRVL
jgi:hypothetical protein